MADEESAHETRAQAGRQGRIAGPNRHGLGDFAWRVLIAVLILALAYLVWRAVHVLVLAFAGLLFAVFLSALSQWLKERTGLAHGWSLTAVVAALVVISSGLGWLLASRLATQFTELAEQLPQSLQRLRDDLDTYAWGHVLVEQVPQAAQSFAQSGDLARVLGVLSGTANFLVAAIVIVFVGVFGAAEPDVYRAGLLHLIPPVGRRRVAQAVDAVAFNLRHWLVGQVVLMILMGVTTTVGLWLLGIPMALTLGLIAGIQELVPYVGPWMSAVPAALIALLLGPWYLGMTLLLYLGLHIVEGYLLVPLVQRRAIHLPPALTLVTQLLLGELLGVLGLFVAAPLTVTAIVLLQMLYVEDTLGDESVEVPGESAGQPR